MSCTRKLLSLRNHSVLKFMNYSAGNVKDLGGKWSQVEQAHETGYFQRKDREKIENLKKELNEGKNMEDIINQRKDMEQKKDEEKKESFVEKWAK